MSSFTSPLKTVLLPNGRRQLLMSFSYHIGSRHSRKVIRVPKGFVTDGASVPEATLLLVMVCVAIYMAGRFFGIVSLEWIGLLLVTLLALLSLFRRWGTLEKAAALHDFLYQLLSDQISHPDYEKIKKWAGKNPRRFADDVFLEALCVDKCETWKRILAYWFERIFGWLAWRRKRKLRTI